MCVGHDVRRMQEETTQSVLQVAFGNLSTGILVSLPQIKKNDLLGCNVIAHTPPTPNGTNTKRKGFR